MRVTAGLARKFRHLPRWAPAAAAALALFACVLAIWLFAFRSGSAAPSENSVVVPTETASPTPVAAIDRLIIPSINVDVPVTAKTVDKDGQMPSPDGPQQVIWYDFSALPGLGGRPGIGGNTILAGHVDYHGYGAAVFWNLRDVKDGDPITVRLADGTQYQYTARSNRVVDPTATSFNDIVASTSEDSLTLITCAGDFDPGTDNYDLRRIVWAVRAG